MTLAPSTLTTIQALIDDLVANHPQIELLVDAEQTAAYAGDYSWRSPGDWQPAAPGPTVALPATVEQVQDVVRTAARHGVSIVPRGAGSGLSGGATPDAGQLVVATDRLNRVVEVAPLDQVVVVEPGVVNARLNEQLEQYGLFYAPDPASFEISAIGGNIATNAGGLRCAKYGVTGDSVLALDVVLADGSLVHIGHRSIKGVSGLDLVSLFVGSEGILGIVVGATLRLRKIPLERRTLTAFFDSTEAGTRGLDAITRSPVEPAVVEFFDQPTLENIDEFSGSALRTRGASLILIELDGYGIDDQTRDLTRHLRAAGAVVAVEAEEAAERLWQLRRSGRGQVEDLWTIGEDIAVPKSRIPDIYASFAGIGRQYGVKISAVSHAGDGNLHPQISRVRLPGETELPQEVSAAATALVQRALDLGGTVSGEHGIGTAKLEWLRLELSDRNRALQQAIRAAMDPQALFNPGKAI
ncbi:FAD-binding oxidoreductase [Pseudoclavibacter sp. 13-3]|uniref:FAD-binding oxidoreductase n=1 Tax=Pseudoclavibacter sp. 13-3 TaxID=2901228 RepID=UPI001E5A8431|nr:FAD-linked oxidase C-terminal domain-containing protein [Pseudoclavibacter sp. 13-3]MCD7101425.1 FAD-binding protein [Pseudoclavibacter sp. 13-3]